MQDILKELEMEQHINKMDKDGCLYSVVKAFSELDLSPRTFDSIKMGYIYLQHLPVLPLRPFQTTVYQKADSQLRTASLYLQNSPLLQSVFRIGFKPQNF